MHIDIYDEYKRNKTEKRNLELFIFSYILYCIYCNVIL